MAKHPGILATFFFTLVIIMALSSTTSFGNLLAIAEAVPSPNFSSNSRMTPLDSACNDSSECVENSHCLNSICTCNEGFEQVSSLLCKIPYLENCTKNSDCNEASGLFCVDSLCQCSPNSGFEYVNDLGSCLNSSATSMYRDVVTLINHAENELARFSNLLQLFAMRSSPEEEEEASDIGNQEATANSSSDLQLPEKLGEIGTQKNESISIQSSVTGNGRDNSFIANETYKALANETTMDKVLPNSFDRIDSFQGEELVKKATVSEEMKAENLKVDVSSTNDKKIKETTTANEPTVLMMSDDVSGNENVPVEDETMKDILAEADKAADDNVAPSVENDYIVLDTPVSDNEINDLLGSGATAPEITPAIYARLAQIEKELTTIAELDMRQGSNTNDVDKPPFAKAQNIPNPLEILLNATNSTRNDEEKAQGFGFQNQNQGPNFFGSNNNPFNRNLTLTDVLPQFLNLLANFLPFLQGFNRVLTSTLLNPNNSQGFNFNNQNQSPGFNFGNQRPGFNFGNQRPGFNFGNNGGSNNNQFPRQRQRPRGIFGILTLPLRTFTRLLQRLIPSNSNSNNFRGR